MKGRDRVNTNGLRSKLNSTDTSAGTVRKDQTNNFPNRWMLNPTDTLTGTIRKDQAASDGNLIRPTPRQVRYEKTKREGPSTLSWLISQ
jgi:hypothetical protein